MNDDRSGEVRGLKNGRVGRIIGRKFIERRG